MKGAFACHGAPQLVPAKGERRFDVLGNGERRKGPYQLEGPGHALGRDAMRRQTGNRLTLEGDQPFARGEEAGDHVHHRGLAGAVRARAARPPLLPSARS